MPTFPKPKTATPSVMRKHSSLSTRFFGIHRNLGLRAKRGGIKGDRRMPGPVGIAEHPVRNRPGCFAKRIFDGETWRKAQFLHDPRTVDAVVAQIGIFVGDRNFDVRKMLSRQFDKAALLIVFADDVKDATS